MTRTVPAKSWSTGSSGTGKTSTAFDFPTKGILQVILNDRCTRTK